MTPTLTLVKTSLEQMKDSKKCHKNLFKEILKNNEPLVLKTLGQKSLTIVVTY